MKKEIKSMIDSISDNMDAYKKFNSERLDTYAKNNQTLKQYIANDVDLTRKYIKAMSFLDWFRRCEPIHSTKLQNEIMATKYSNLTKYMEYHSYKDVNFIKEIECSVTTSCDSGLYVPLESYNGYNTLYVNSSDVGSISIGDQTIKINHEKPKEEIKYEDTIAYVLDCPFKFNEGIVIAVYNYLERMIEKDEEIKKYENKSESSKKGQSRDAK